MAAVDNGLFRRSNSDQKIKKWLRSYSRILVPDDHLIAKLTSRRFHLIKGQLANFSIAPRSKFRSHSDHCLNFLYSSHLLLLPYASTRPATFLLLRRSKYALHRPCLTSKWGVYSVRISTIRWQHSLLCCSYSHNGWS